MPFIGIYRSLFTSSQESPEKVKDIIYVTVCEMRPASVFYMEAVDDAGNKYDIANAYYFPMKIWFCKKRPAQFRYKSGERYMAEVTPYKKPDYIGNIGRVDIIKISPFGTKMYL